MRHELYENGVLIGYESPISSKPDLIAYAAQLRWQRETSGIDVGGVRVATDDRSKVMVMGARMRAAADPELVEQWVADDGTVHALNADSVWAISDAVAAHVSACFAIFADVKTQIGSGAITNTDEIEAAFAAQGA